MVSTGETYAFVPARGGWPARDWALRSTATCSGCKLAAACQSS